GGGGGGDRGADEHPERERAAALAELDRNRGQRAADQTADVTADRDPRDREAEDEVDQDQAPDPAVHDRDPSGSQLDGGGAGHAEDRTRGADGERVRGQEQRAERAGHQRDAVDDGELQRADRRLEQAPDQIED